MNIIKDSLDLIGNTPLLLVKNLDTGPCNLYLKLESFNLGGSIKDRPVKNMIIESEKQSQTKINSININISIADSLSRYYQSEIFISMNRLENSMANINILSDNDTRREYLEAYARLNQIYQTENENDKQDINWKSYDIENDKFN